MAHYSEYEQIAQHNEGGYQNSPHDVAGNTNSRGEMVGTNHGISAQQYEAFLGHPPTAQEMRDMPADTARGILQHNFWDTARGNEIANQHAANAIADFTVTSGHVGIHVAEERMWLDGHHVDPTRDNHALSDQAVQALNGMDREHMNQFLHNYNHDRQAFYENLAQHPQYAHNLHSWENRATMHPVEQPPPEANAANGQFTVHNIQSVLFQNHPEHVDGMAGPGTQHALQHWQENNHLPPSGYFDQATRDLMNQSILQQEAAQAAAAHSGAAAQNGAEHGVGDNGAAGHGGLGAGAGAATHEGAAPTAGAAIASHEGAASAGAGSHGGAASTGAASHGGASAHGGATAHGGAGHGGADPGAGAAGGI